MAPEQLERGEFSVQSDIYSLGLILYELFTGRRLFHGSSAGDLMAVRHNTDPQSISRELQQVDPVVQRIIVRALEQVPAARPDLASIIAALPGGDRLQAMVDAGETPSPEMVAAAEQVGDLATPVAAALLVAAIAGALFVAAAGRKTMLHHLVPLPKEPAALADRAREVIEKFGYGGKAVAWSYTFAAQPAVIGAIAQSDRSPGRWRRLQSLDAPAIVFQYRESPYMLVPWSAMAMVTSNDPPFGDQGETRVSLDPRGRLLEFAAGGPPLEAPPAGAAQPDWQPFLNEAGLDLSSLRAVTPIRASPVDTDAKSAWLARKGAEQVRVEAASYHARPVWFTVMSAGEMSPSNSSAVSRSLISVPATAPVGLMIGLFITIVAVTARRNVRRGRGDRAGARRIAAVAFVAATLTFVLRDAAPLHRLVMGLQFSGLHGMTAWLVYLALEPFVRRRWPRLLIGWSRLLSGQWRDAMVGRDILIGATAGMVWALLRRLSIVAPVWFGKPPAVPIFAYMSALGNPKHALFLFVYAVTIVLSASLVTLFSLVLFRSVFRSDAAALAIMVALATAATLMSTETLPVQIAFAFVTEVLAVLLLWRFGLLALAAAGCLGAAFLYAPLTLDSTSWYFGRSLFYIAMLLGVAVYGFAVSLGGKKLLPEME
jgi:serine/threonine-protein kinase